MAKEDILKKLDMLRANVNDLEGTDTDKTDALDMIAEIRADVEKLEG